MTFVKFIDSLQSHFLAVAFLCNDHAKLLNSLRLHTSQLPFGIMTLQFSYWHEISFPRKFHFGCMYVVGMYYRIPFWYLTFGLYVSNSILVCILVCTYFLA
jgi:hypothetical protein